MIDNPHQQFSIDTSCLIESWNHIYQIDIFPSIWVHLEFHLRIETAVISVQVFEEIRKQDDDLHDWCKERKDLFTDISEAQIEKLQGIMQRHPRIAAKANRNFADPWVIALAQTFEEPAIVVTEERGGKESNPKFPMFAERKACGATLSTGSCVRPGGKKNRSASRKIRALSWPQGPVLHDTISTSETLQARTMLA